MGYYHPLGKQKKLADMYGVKGVNSPRPGFNEDERRTSNEVERDIRKAMMDDYSTREFLKYNKDTRDEANEIKNLRKQNNFIHDEMKQAHKDNGNGGKYSSDADRGGVAQKSFENYEAKQRSYVDDQLKQMGKRNAQEDSVGDTSKPYVKSDALKRAEDNIERSQSPQAEDSSTESQNRDKAQSFLDLYRTDFISGNS